MKTTRRYGRNRATTTSNGPRTSSGGDHATSCAGRCCPAGNSGAAGLVQVLASREEIVMGRLPVIIAAAVLASVTACAASPGPAPAQRGASRERPALLVLPGLRLRWRLRPLPEGASATGITASGRQAAQRHDAAAEIVRSLGNEAERRRRVVDHGERAELGRRAASEIVRGAGDVGSSLLPH